MSKGSAHFVSLKELVIASCIVVTYFSVQLSRRFNGVAFNGLMKCT